ncbi:hypothetical protein J5N97_009947 [Dioscorea zingiberensis]|uniref:Bifunctional inhibitor/plant lipid transfer protein/seed storage helical domain-containing protein n=1 Tax=Dioscorea zingiberensis TaxID=325984 RepID=A0A9D5HN64_9LILI|nr:hypothetical protein J5N97_009947 [Dioscorea zingiberensis]
MVISVQQVVGYVVLVTLVVNVIMAPVELVSGQEPGNDCGGPPLRDLMNKCQPFDDEPEPPTKDCCIALQNANITNICSCFGRIERGIILQKLSYIAQQCGRPLPPGTQCASYIVPPPPSA